MGWMMAGMLTQLPLPLLPAGAAEIAPGVGLVTGDDGGGLVSVHGLATFAWDAGDEAGRQHTSPAARSVRVVRAWICRVPPAFAGTRRVTCRRLTVCPLRGPSLMVSVIVVSARS